MPITLNYNPSAQSVGGAAFSAGNENLRRYQEAQALAQQQLAQQERMQQAGFANSQQLQGQQLDYNSRATALGILANEATQQTGFTQQSGLQDQQLQSAAQLQDQRLQYGYQESQNQIANQQYLQQQQQGAQFGLQYLQGQQQFANQAQQLAGNSALQNQASQQRIDFAQFELDATSQAKLNQIQQNRAKLEELKTRGQISDSQYQYADTEIKSRELGLSKTLPQQKNQDLASQLNSSLVQHKGTGQWFQQDPQTGGFDLVQPPQQQQNPFELQKLKYEQEKLKGVATLAQKFYSDALKTEGPPMSMEQAYQYAQQAYGVQSQTPVENPGSVRQVNSDAEVLQLPSGTIYRGPDGVVRRRR